MPEEKPYHIAAIDDLQSNYSPDNLRRELRECREVIALTITEDNSSPQQVARAHILRYLDLQLSRAIRWADDEADLLAFVLRSQIDLWAWAKFVSRSVAETEQFLDETVIDVQELHEKMGRAFSRRDRAITQFGTRSEDPVQ